MKKVIERGRVEIPEAQGIKRAIDKYHGENIKLKKKAVVEHEKARMHIYQAKDKGQWELYKQMKDDAAIPLVAVRRKKKNIGGQLAGTVAASPKEVDSIIREVYGEIYKGNLRKGEPAEEMADRYVEEYGEHILQQPEALIEDITGEDVEKVVRTQKETAGGMDQWMPAEFKLLSREACNSLADMYMMVERGAKWPEATTMARAAFLAKDEEPDLDPLAYRVLLMLATAYRTWAKVRLEHLHPWISTWALEEIYAGVEGQGANDAAYATAVEIETCRLAGVNYSGGAADIFKCFDQIQRPIVYRIMEMAGMPKSILTAYRNFQEELRVRNTIAGGLGEAYAKPTSVPQGDPLSMMVTSLLLRAWVVQMRRCAVKPRILADDLQILSQGENHLKNFEYAFTKTHKHIEDMGGG